MNQSAYFLISLFFFLLACQDCPKCPEPPTELKFQVVDILGKDVTAGDPPKFDKSEIYLTYTENGVERGTKLELDTFQPGKTIFNATQVPLLARRGIVNYKLYISETPETLETSLSVIKTVCCEYKLYDYLLMNGEEVPGSDEDDYVFLLQK